LARRTSSKVRILYTYSTSHLSKTDLVRFHYALKGRDGKSGVLKVTQTEFLAKSVLLCNRDADAEIRQFLRYWKCKYKRRILDTTSKKPTSVLFVYSTNQLSKSDLVRFYYALKGRDGQSGILKRTKSTQLARRVLFTKIKQMNELKDFFSLWNVPTKILEVKELNE